MSENKRICIYCGANTGSNPKILTEVQHFIDLLVQQPFDLVYGGGKTGLMGMVASKFLEANKNVIGVRPNKLIKGEGFHNELSELLVVKGMHERKSKMIALSDAFIALPGGVGTLDEIIDVYTQVKIGFLNKFCGILNVDNCYNGLTILLKDMVRNGYLKPDDKELLHITSSAEILLKKMKQQFNNNHQRP